ncbi:hypothetical protein [Halorubrum vacuolatum]|nr:hypothetical protein [Halorubrum vacuolatum]
MSGQLGDDPPTYGYFGTAKVYATGAITVPSLLLRHGYLSEGMEVTWYVSPDGHPIFVEDNERAPHDFETVDSTPVRRDKNTEVIQIPKRFFGTYKGHPGIPEALKQQPVRESARIEHEDRYHFIRERVNHPKSGPLNMYRLLKWPDMAALSDDELGDYFVSFSQRSKLLDSVTVESCSEYPDSVFSVVTAVFEDGKDHL